MAREGQSMRALLQRSLVAIQAEQRPAARALAGAAAGLRVAVAIGREQFGLTVIEEALTTVDDLTAPQMTLWATPGAVRALVGGRSTVVNALMQGGLDLRGRVADLAQFDEVVLVFVQAMFRSTSAAELARAVLETTTIEERTDGHIAKRSPKRESPRPGSRDRRSHGGSRAGSPRLSG